MIDAYTLYSGCVVIYHGSKKRTFHYCQSDSLHVMYQADDSLKSDIHLFYLYNLVKSTN